MILDEAGEVCFITRVRKRSFVEGSILMPTALISFDREVYHTRRMQRVFCVRFSADSTYVLSGSDETNIR